MDEFDRQLKSPSQQDMSLAKSDDRQSTHPITRKNSIPVTAQVHHLQTYDPKEHKTTFKCRWKGVFDMRVAN